MAILKIPHNTALTVNFKLKKHANLFYETKTKIKGIHHRLVSILVSALVIKSIFYVNGSIINAYVTQ